MGKVIVEVHYSGGNYAAHIPVLPGVVVTGDTVTEIENQMKEALPFHLEGMRETGGHIPKVFEDKYVLAFEFPADALLEYYSGIFTKAALSRLTGINERQLWHYAAGKSRPRPAQIKRIEAGLHRLGHELLSLQLHGS